MQQGWGPGQGGQGYGPPPGYGPPMQGPPPKKGMGAGTIILLVLVGLFVLGGGSCVLCMAIGAGAAANAGNHGKPSTGAGQAATQNETATPVTIGAILSAYKGNEIAADNSYKGKLVQITGGLVDDVKKDILDQPFVTIGTGAAFEIPQVQCELQADQVGKAATLQKGQKITVRGRVHGLLMNVQLHECEVL